jgi:hypothetical protein
VFLRHQGQESLQRRIITLSASGKIIANHPQAGGSILDIAIGHIIKKSAEGIKAGCITSHTGAE